MPVSPRSARLALPILLTATAAAGASGPMEGFRFCAAPVAPECIAAERAYRDAAQTRACEQDVARFVASAFAYRACLQREVQRAVLETNETVDRFKCGVAAGRRCSDEDMRKANGR